MKIRKTGIIILFLTITINLACLSATAQDLVKNYKFTEDVTLQGVFGGYTMPFHLDKYWLVGDDSFLQINFSQSEIKQYKYSTLTVYLNDYPIKSVLLHEWKTENNQLKVSLPKEKLLPGFNQLSIKTYHRITDEKCFTDQINQANWIILKKSSYLHLQYALKQDNIALKDYPYPYLQNALDQPVTSRIVLAHQPSDREITAAVLLAADLGRRQPFKDIIVPIVRFDQLTAEDKKSNLIYLSAIDKLPKEYLGTFTSQEINSLVNKGMLKTTTSPYFSSRKMLFILAKDDYKLLDCVRTLSEDSLLGQMRGNVQLIGTYPEVLKEPDSSDRITLAQLGYGDLLLKGIFYQQTSFNVKIPKDKKLAGKALLSLNYHYSKVLNFDKSSVTVYLNGIPIKSQKLMPEKADDDRMIIEIPSEYKSRNYFEFKVVFYLEPSKLDCNIRGDNNIWASLSSQSYLDFFQQAKERILLNDYPSPLVQDASFNQLSIVIPDEPNSQELTIASNLAAFLGRNVKSLGNLEVVQSKNLQQKKGNLVVIGTPARNQTLQSLNKHLYIKFSEDYQSFLSNEKIALLEHFSGLSSTVQLITSPWANEKFIFVFASPNMESLYRSQIFLNSSEYVERLQGQGAVIDEYGYLQTAFFDYKAKGEKNPNLFQQLLASKDSSKEMLILLALILGTSVLVLGLVFVFWKKKF